MLAGGVDVNLLPREMACCAGERVMYHTIFRLEPKEARRAAGATNRRQHSTRRSLVLLWLLFSLFFFG